MKYGIANVKAKVGGGGGADLNLAYGLTPPSDTSKIWVKCEEPSAVKIEANRQLVVSSNENAKLTRTETIANTRTRKNIAIGKSQYMLEVGNYIYFLGYKSNTAEDRAYFLGTYYQDGLYKYNKITGEVTTINSSSGYAVFKYDDNTILYLYAEYSDGYNYARIRLYDIETNTLIRSINKTISSTAYIQGAFYYNNKIYSGYVNSASSFYLTIIDMVESTLTSTAITSTNMDANVKGKGVVYYNGYIYCVLAKTTNVTKLVRIVEGTTTMEEVANIPNAIGNKPILSYDAYLYGNKMILLNMNYGSSAGSYDNRILIVDLDTYNVETITLDASSSRSYAVVNENTGDIVLWGGWPTSSGTNTQKRTIYNIYSLEENTLDLYYDTLSSLNIKLIDTETLTMDAPINHAWLGDSNDIAQPVDFFYYKNSLWWGVNCLGYTQLSNCVISASDVSIDLNSATSDTQTITITPTWANETGVITTSVATSDDTLATASLSGDSLVVNALAVGTPTITISVVDEYGTTYTKSITITITNSGA